MPGVRTVSVLALLSMLALAACTTIAPAGPAASVAASAPIALASQPEPALTDEPIVDQPTDEPTVEQPTDEPPPVEQPTDQPPLAEPTDEPVDRPTDQPPFPTDDGEPTLPNLQVVTLTFDPEQPLPGEEVDAVLTLANSGLDVNDSFKSILRVEEEEPGGALFQLPLDDVRALRQGETAEVQTTFTMPEAGRYTVTAIVDAEMTVAEGNEDDNARQFPLQTLVAPNLAFAENGFLITQGDGPNYVATITYTNNGIATLDTPPYFNVRFYWDAADGSSSGDFGTFQVPGGTAEPGHSLITAFNITVNPGEYIAYALLDPDDSIVEMNEDDNSARFDFTAP